MVNKLLLAGLAVVSAAMLGSCTDPNDPDDGGKSKTVKVGRFDLSDAKSVYLQATESRADENQFMKVDSEGNVSVVVMECVVGNDGSQQTVRNDISTHPDKIVNLSKSWMFLYDCQFSCPSNPEIVYSLRSQYISRDEQLSQFNMLVNKQTGKIYYISGEVCQNYFGINSYTDGCYAKETSVSELYIQSVEKGLAKIAVSADGTAQITEIGGAGMDFLVQPNGTIVFFDGMEGYCYLTIRYPNGGYEEIYYSYTDPEGSTFPEETYFNLIDDKIYLITIHNDYTYGEYGSIDEMTQTATIRTLNIGTYYGNWTVSQPLYTVTQTLHEEWGEYGYYWKGEPWNDNIGSIYMSRNYLILGEVAAINKQTGALTILKEEYYGSSPVILPDKSNVYKGKAWHVWSDGAKWFDCETLDSGKIHYDIPDLTDCDVNDWIPDIPSGENTITAKRRYDGKQIIVTIDIETGNVKSISEIAQTSNIITLIPLN